MLLGTTSIKAARNMLMKLTPAVQFAITICSAFALIFLCNKETVQTLLYKEIVRKIDLRCQFHQQQAAFALLLQNYKPK